MSKIIKTNCQTLNLYLESQYITEFWEHCNQVQRPWEQE